MTKRSKGPRRKTRYKLQRKKRDRGKSPITYILQDFDVGAKVNIKIDPSAHKGQPHHRFHGYTGTVVGKQGGALIVRIVEGKKKKDLLILPPHLRRFSPEKKEKKAWRTKARKPARHPHADKQTAVKGPVKEPAKEPSPNGDEGVEVSEEKPEKELVFEIIEK